MSRLDRQRAEDFTTHVVFWGIADAELDEVVLFFLSREAAEQELRTILADEPGWEEQLSLMLVDFSSAPPKVEFAADVPGA